MLALNIIWACIGFIIYILGGVVCSRICTEIIRNKHTEANEVLWFWAGFLFNVIAVFMTLCVKSENNDK